MSLSKRIFTFFVLVALLVSARPPLTASADEGGAADAVPTICTPGTGVKLPAQRILFIGGLFSEEIDKHLRGLIAASRPPCAVTITSVILPDT